MLQREPARLENAVEEMIRWATPVRHFLRHAQEDYVLRGKPLRKRWCSDVGTCPRTATSSLRRLAALRRRARECLGHLAFGTGVHFSWRAARRVELRHFFAELSRLESIELTGRVVHLRDLRRRAESGFRSAIAFANVSVDGVDGVDGVAGIEDALETEPCAGADGAAFMRSRDARIEAVAGVGACPARSRPAS